MTKKHLHKNRCSRYALMIAAAITVPSSVVNAAVTIDEEVRTIESDTSFTELTVGGFGRIDLVDSTLTILGNSTIQPGASTGIDIQAIGISGTGNLIVGDSSTSSELTIRRNTTFTGTTEIKANATVILEDTQGLQRSSGITILNGASLINKAGGAQIDAIVIDAGGILDLKDSLTIGADGGGSTLAGELKSELDSNGGNPSLGIKGDTTISNTNPEFGGVVQIRDSATLTLTATGAIGEADDADFGDIQIESGSTLVTAATDAINPGREIRVESEFVTAENGFRGATWKVDADQTIARLYTQVNSDIQIADGVTLRLNTASDPTDGFDQLQGDISGKGDLRFSGTGELYISPDIEFGNGNGGQTSFTGDTFVDGGGKLYLQNTGALGGSSSLRIYSGSTVILQSIAATMEDETLALFKENGIPLPNAANALNTAINIDLGSGDNSAATLDVGANQSINAIVTGTQGTVSVAEGATFTVNGNITGNGPITLTGSGRTVLAENSNAVTGAVIGNNVSLTNNGLIEADEETLAATLNGSSNSTASDLTITNTGTIKTVGISTGNNAIYLKDSDQVTINNSGTIRARGSTGIHLTLSEDARIINSGTISAANKNGILLEGEGDSFSLNAYIENSGTISTDEDNDAIDLQLSKNARVVNTGTIAAGNKEGETANNGIFLEDSENAVVENSGTISASGNDGIDLENSTDARVINTGNITAGGSNGILLEGSTGARIENTGNITAGGSNGILLKGSTGARIENTGTIQATRNAIDGADGDSPVSNATIVNSGTLRAEGNTVALQDNSVLRNSGTIEATEANENAIYARGTGTVVTLEPGSRIIGDIETENAGNTLQLNMTAAGSVIYETTGDWTLESLDGQPVVEGSVIAAGVGNLETADELMHRRSVDLAYSLDRLAMQQANNKGFPILVDVYTGDEERQSHTVDGATLPHYGLDTTGLTLATTIDIAERPVMLFANYSDEDLDLDSNTHRIRAKGARVGVSTDSLFQIGGIDFGSHLVIGRTEHDGDREVMINTTGSTGSIQQESEWRSDMWEIGVSARYKKTVTPSVTFTLTPEMNVHQERIEAYQESEQFSWDKRNITQGRAAINSSFQYVVSEKTNIAAGLNLWHREVLSGETADYTLAGTQVSYEDPMHEDQGLSLQLSLNHMLNENFSLSATAAGNRTTEETDGWQIGVSLSGHF